MSDYRQPGNRFPASIALGLLLLGLSVSAGWLLRIPQLTQVVPGFTSMVFNTALSFGLMGAALLLSARPGLRAGPAAMATAATAGILCALNLLQILSGLSLGINAPALHAWIVDGNPKPGQMSLPTSLCFVLASLAFVLMHRATRGVATLRLARALSALVFCIAGMALIGYTLQLEILFRWYAFTRMAVHTAAGLFALGLALWSRLNAIEALDRRSLDARIIALGTWMLVFIAASAMISTTLTLKPEIDRSLADGLRLTHQARADLLDTALTLRAERARMAATRPKLIQMLQDLVAASASISTVDAEYLASFQPHGFSLVRLLDADDRPLAQAGTALTRAALAAELPAVEGEQRTLLWQDGFVLRQRFQVQVQGIRAGLIETEQHLPQLDLILHRGPDPDGWRRTELCAQTATGMACFPTQGQAAAYVPQLAARNGPTPLRLARDGQSGVTTFRAEDGDVMMSAYGPVGAQGLVAATSLDSSRLFAPLSNRLSFGFLVVAGVTVVGMLALRRSVRPLTNALVQAEQRFRGLVDSLQEGVILQGPGSEVLAANPAATRILGTDARTPLNTVAGGLRWRLIDEHGKELPPQDYPAPKALRTSQGEVDVVRGLIDLEGRLRWLQLSSILTQEGQDRAVVLSFEDITDKRLAQERLEESEARYQLMVDQVTDYAILMLDVEGRVTSWNQGAAHITGYSAEEIIGQHVARFSCEEDRIDGKPARNLATAAREGRGEFEDWRLRKDGTRFWASVVISAVRDAQGKLLGYAQLIRDLTERHRAEQELAEAWRRVQAMIDSSPFGIVATDLDGIIRHMNPAGERMTGYPREELVGKLTPAAYHDPEEIRTRARELSDEVGRQIAPGLDAFVCKARLGLKEEREWTCVRKDGTRFPIFSSITALRDADGALVGYMGVAYDITERRRQEEYTRHVANHDYLTGLPMRRLMDDRLQVAMARARRDHRRVGLLLTDLDHFKRINDSLGHHVGDELLKEVAQRLLGCVRASDTVARMGGDEFVILVPDVEDVASIERIAQLVVDRVSVPLRIGSHELHVSPSVGLAIFPNDADDAAGLLKNADAAMYAAKQAGRGCYRVFNRQMQREADERLLMENDLRLALQRGQLELHYQPQVCLDSGRVIGMEALMRWTHPVRGPISPAQFIPIAEESELIVELGEWALRTACQAARRMQLASGQPLRMAVNLSARQFRAPGLPALIADALKSSGLDPTHLEVEITESVLMSDADEAIQRLAGIRAQGIKVAVDDFGTGYSSLAYVTRFAIDTLKIDRSFVQRLPGSANDEAVVQAIIALARSLNVHVVAEGVETAAQLGFLRARQCDAAQGFLFGKAVPQDRFSVQGFHIGKALPEPQLLQSLSREGPASA